MLIKSENRAFSPFRMPMFAPFFIKKSHIVGEKQQKMSGNVVKRFRICFHVYKHVLGHVEISQTACRSIFGKKRFFAIKKYQFF